MIKNAAKKGDSDDIDKAQWELAAKVCENQGGGLVTVTDDDEIDWIKSYKKSWGPDSCTEAACYMCQGSGTERL